MNLRDLNLRDLKALKNIDRDDVLGLLGLETRREPTDWIVPTLTAFGVGVLVGAGVGLLLAPKSGRELRDDLRTRLQGEADQAALSSVPSASAPNPRPV